MSIIRSTRPPPPALKLAPSSLFDFLGCVGIDARIDILRFRFRMIAEQCDPQYRQTGEEDPQYSCAHAGAQVSASARSKFPPRISSMSLLEYFRRTNPSVKSKIFFA